MAEKSWHLVTYDVRDPKRLRKVAKKLEGYGERLQYSVFRCRLDHTTLEKLCWELTGIMEKEDDLLVMPICARCAERIPIHSSGDQSTWVKAPPTFRIV
ncbi:MAG: CRISPR-associated endonuclease Cas2 [Planctomycetes bacterium]|jgi:CRISPR-associated protein Cas2|nr:CRISPR-associated endonuclease Cas2 [Planctomycetota bacterium]